MNLPSGNWASGSSLALLDLLDLLLTNERLAKLEKKMSSSADDVKGSERSDLGRGRGLGRAQGT